MPTENPRSELEAWFEEMGADLMVGEVTRDCFKESLQENPVLLPNIPVKNEGLENPLWSFVPDTIQKEAEKRAALVSSLESLKESLQNFEGCHLKNTAIQMVFSDGPPTAPVMLIGEAPGAEEDRLGKPFVGMSGKLLDKMFGCIGLDRQTSLYITNVVPWRPPGNRTPSTEEISACLPFLKRHIELIAPRVICLVGGTAAKALLGPTEGIVRLRGRWHDYVTPNTNAVIPTLALYHPAYLLRSPSKKREMWQDLLSLDQALKDGQSQKHVV